MEMTNFFNSTELVELNSVEMIAVEGGSRVGDFLHALWDGVCDYFNQK